MSPVSPGHPLSLILGIMSDMQEMVVGRIMDRVSDWILSSGKVIA